MVISTSTAYITTANVSGASPQVAVFAGANTVNGYSGFLWDNSNTRMVVNGTINATSSNFTNLNASSTVLTNSTTTNQSVFSAITGPTFLALDSNHILMATSTPVLTVTGSGSLTSTGGTSPNIALVTLANNAVLFGQGSATIGTSTNFSWLNGSNLFSVNGTINATSSLFTNSTTTNQSVFSAITGPTFLALDSNHILMATSTPVLAVTGSGNIASSGGTSPNLTFTGTLPILNGGTGQTTLAAANIVTANASAGQVPYFTAPTTQSGSANFLWNNTSNLLTINGTINASTSNFTNLNASSTVLTNATTTGQSVLLGQTNGKLLALDQNGIIISTSTAYQTALSNPDTGTGASPQIAYWSSATGLTGASGFLWDNSNTRMVVNGTINATTSNFTNLNASSTVLTNSTTTNQSVFSAITGPTFLALDSNHILMATSTPVLAVTGSGNIASSGGTSPNLTFTGTLPILNGGTGQTTLAAANIVTANASAGQVPYFTAPTTQSGSANFLWNNTSNLLTINGTINASTSNFTNLNASSTVLTNATTTGQSVLLGQTNGKLLALDQNGIIISTSTAYITTANVSGASPQVAVFAGANTVNGYSGFLWDNSNTRMVVNGTINATTSNFTNLNASSTVLTNSTTTNQSVFSAITGPTFLALDSNHILMATSTPVLAVTGSGSLTSTGGTSPNIALVTLANNAVLFGQGSATIGTSTNFSWLNGSNLFSVNGTINATSSLFTNATSSNLAATSLTSALPVRSTTAGYLYNGAINLSSGSSDITGTLAIGSGGTGASTLAGANIVTANASAGQVPYFTAPTTQSGSANFLWNNTSNLLTINGTINASTSNFTNLNASSTVLTNATTTGQSVLLGQTNGKLLALDQNGIIISTSTAYITTANVSGASPQVAVFAGANTVNGYSGFLWDNSNTRMVVNGTINATTSNFTNLNASSTVLTNSTTTNQSVFSAITGPTFLALDSNHILMATSTPVLAVTGSGNIASSGGTSPNLTFTGTLPILNGGTGQTTLAAANIVTANASAGQVPYFTAPTTQAGSANFLWNNTSNLLTVNGTINATTSNFTNLNASSTVLTNATTTGQFYTLGQTILAANGGNVGIGTTTVGSRLVIQGSTADNTANALQINNSSGTGLVTVRNDGNVGIGTTAPAHKLEVTGDIYASGNITCGGTCGGGGSSQWTTTGSDIYYNTGTSASGPPRREVH